MGFFKNPFALGVDWATDPIPGDREWQRHESPRPDSLLAVEEAVRLSGVSGDEVDRVDCLVRVWAVLSGLGQHLFEAGGDPKAARGLGLVASRPDFSEELLWNYFSHHGALGVAVQKKVAEAFASGQVARILAEVVREGECRVAVVGHDRI